MTAPAPSADEQAQIDRFGIFDEEDRCWSMADDFNPDCPIGSARCVRTARHDDEHVWEAAP